MAIIFYDHLIPWHKVDAHIKSHQLSGEERVEFIEIFEETVHTEILIIILNHLSKEAHHEFVDNFLATPHDKKHLAYLKKHHPEIEIRLKSELEKLIDQLLEEIS